MELLENIKREGRFRPFYCSREKSCFGQLTCMSARSGAGTEAKPCRVDAVDIYHNEANSSIITKGGGAYVACVTQSIDKTQFAQILMGEKLASPLLCPLKGHSLVGLQETYLAPCRCPKTTSISTMVDTQLP